MTETTSTPKTKEPKLGRLSCDGFIKQDRLKMVARLNATLPEGWQAEEQAGVWLMQGTQPRACNWDRHVVWFNGLPAEDIDVESSTVLKTQLEAYGWQASMQDAFLSVAEGRAGTLG